MYNIKTKSDLLEDPVRGLQAVAAWFAKYCPDVSKWHLVFSKEERRTLPKKWSKVRKQCLARFLQQSDVL